MTRLKKNRVVYRPESRIRHPLQLFREMGRDLLASRELAWRLLVRDISAQYRQSLLGICWAFIPPIITAAGLTLAKNNGIVNIGNTELPYVAYVMFSMSLWQTFVEALNGPIQAVTAAKAMLAKINFPREALIVAKLGEVFFNFGIKLILIVGLFIWFNIVRNICRFNVSSNGGFIPGCYQRFNINYWILAVSHTSTFSITY